MKPSWLTWLEMMPSSTAMSCGARRAAVALGSFGVADIEKHAERALTRIQRQQEGLAVFGSIDAALARTPAEVMLFATAGDLTDREFQDYWRWSPEQRAARFARSVNPVTLRECVSEIRYWSWLYRIRSALADIGDGEPLVTLREWYVKDLLTVLPPASLEEARQVGGKLSPI